jgi:two-component sensor histidine kinase
MKTEDILRIITNLEEEMRVLRDRVNSMSEMQEQLNEVDDRTRQFKKWTQTSHPDFDLGA